MSMSPKVYETITGLCVCACVCACMCARMDLDVTGLLALAGFQAFGGSQGVGRAGGWTAEETSAGQGHPRQATDLRPLHQLLQVR